MGLGFDWDGDGKQGMFDDLVTLQMLEKWQKDGKKPGKGSGGCGTCAVSVLAVPAVLIAVILKAKGIL